MRLELDVPDKADLDAVLALRVRARSGALVPLSEIAVVEKTTWDNTIYHKDLLPMSWVTADAVGKTDSPLYGMFELVSALKKELPAGTDLQQSFIAQPEDPYRPSVKWDGEWQITYETFRDMGLAYSVGLILIYLLVVAQFGSYAVPLVIMAPIPLTIIGVMPGHALLGAQFTATSMIGMIALAGIIVRNSILLVDFINLEVERGRGLADAVIGAAAVRARPIALTAVAAMTGGFFILDDPIFNGLAVSLIFGILVSTVLTLVLIPIFYFSYRNRSDKPLPERSEGEYMAKVIVMGAGLGGVACAYEMKKKLGKGHEVTVVGSSPFFEFTPSNPWIMVGWRTAPQTRVDLAKPLAGKSIDWVPRMVQRDRRTGLDADARGRGQARLRLPRHHDRPEAGIRGSAGSRSLGIHAVRLHAWARAAGLGEIPAVRAGAGPDRDRSGAGRELLRPGVRIGDDPRHRPAPPQDPRPRADDLRHRRTVHRPHGPWRCR